MSDQTIKGDSRFIHGEDLQRGGKWCNVTLTVKSVGEKDSMKALNGKLIKGFPVCFVETEKMMVVDGGNLRLLKAATRTVDRSEMAGKKVTIYPVSGNWWGETGVLGVRIRVPNGWPGPKIAEKDLGTDLVSNDTGKDS